MKKFLIGSVGAVALIGLAIPAGATLDIPGVDIEVDRIHDKIAVEFCVSADTTDDDIDNPTFQVLASKLFVRGVLFAGTVDEDPLDIDLNEDGDSEDVFNVSYASYETYLSTEGESKVLSVTDSDGNPVVLELGVVEIESFEKHYGLHLTGEACQAGPTGPAGPAGANGSNGADGADGADGAAGSAGAVGPAGPAGPAGQTVVVEKIVQVPVAAPVALPRTA